MRQLRVLTLCGLMCLSPEVRAWDSVREVIHGSARVLEKGETIIGVVSPLAYGVHERVTLFTHPALWLLLTPNAWLRLSLLGESYGVSLETGFQQSFLALQGTGSDDGSSQGDYPGFVQAGAIYSQAFGRDIQMSIAGGYFAEFQDKNTGSDVSGFYYRVGLHILLGGRYLILANVRGQAYGTRDWTIPSGTAIFAWQSGRMRLGGGVAVGEFVIATGNMRLNDNAEAVPETLKLPVYPWLDVWWRF